MSATSHFSTEQLKVLLLTQARAGEEAVARNRELKAEVRRLRRELAKVPSEADLKAAYRRGYQAGHMAASRSVTCLT